VLLEATGGLERCCADTLVLAGLDVMVVNPRQAHHQGNLMNRDQAVPVIIWAR
jgi:transposase